MAKETETKADQFDDLFAAEERRPLLEEGIYQAQCVKYEKGISHARSSKLFLTFKILNATSLDNQPELFMAMNLINSKTGKPFKKVPCGTKYYKQWVIANGNVPPARGDRMSPNIFKDRIFEVKVKTVKPKHSDGIPMPECFYYSLVEYIIKRAA